ncbi:MAG: HD domain-containing phosphohydrolase [Rhodanobacter sp.]
MRRLARTEVAHAQMPAISHRLAPANTTGAPHGSHKLSLAVTTCPHDGGDVNTCRSRGAQAARSASITEAEAQGQSSLRRLAPRFADYALTRAQLLPALAMTDASVTVACVLLGLACAVFACWMVLRQRALLRSLRKVVSDQRQMRDLWQILLSKTEGPIDNDMKQAVMMADGLARLAGIKDDAILDDLRTGFLLRDIGDLTLPDANLDKPDRLTSDEFAAMRLHPGRGRALLAQAGYSRRVQEIVHAHHERWDGMGYPQALKHEDIPLLARIVSIVDVWDAMRSARTYRPGLCPSSVIDYLSLGAGSQFDPQLAALFIANEPALKNCDRRNASRRPWAVKQSVKNGSGESAGSPAEIGQFGKDTKSSEAA